LLTIETIIYIIVLFQIFNKLARLMLSIRYRDMIPQPTLRRPQMFGLFAPRKLANAVAALVATLVVFTTALTPFAAPALAVPTAATTR
jgi:hypothetical protein